MLLPLLLLMVALTWVLWASLQAWKVFHLPQMLVVLVLLMVLVLMHWWLVLLGLMLWSLLLVLPVRLVGPLLPELLLHLGQVL